MNKKLISTQLTDANVATVLSLLADSPGRLHTASQNLANNQLDQPLGAGERSLTEDLAHLINCEARTSEAIYLALLVREPLMPKVHPERQLGKLLRFEQLPFAELLAYFTLRRTVLLNVLNSLNTKQWSRATRQEGKQRQESVYWLARSLALHEVEHLIDIERNKL